MPAAAGSPSGSPARAQRAPETPVDVPQDTGWACADGGHDVPAAQAAAGRPCRRRVQVGDGSSGIAPARPRPGRRTRALVLAPVRRRRSRTSRCRALYARRRLPWCRVRPRLMCPNPPVGARRSEQFGDGSRALRARRFRATSASDGRMTRREINRTWAMAAGADRGSGSSRQCASRARKRFTTRSSSEW